MKSLLFILFGTIFVNVCFSQLNNIDSILNEYDRMYRYELNNSDSILINSFVGILKDDCSQLSRYLRSNKYSGKFKAEIAKELILEGKCLTQIVENIEMEHYSSNSLRPHEIINFPIMDLLQDLTLMNELVQKLSEDQSLCKATYSTSKSFLEKFYKKQFLQCYIALKKEKLNECELEYIDLHLK